MKKLFSTVLAVCCMVMMLSMTAFAADLATVTASVDGNTYASGNTVTMYCDQAAASQAFTANGRSTIIWDLMSCTWTLDGAQISSGRTCYTEGLAVGTHTLSFSAKAPRWAVATPDYEATLTVVVQHFSPLTIHGPVKEKCQDSYQNCPKCGALFDMDGNAIDSIPAKHTPVAIPAVAPTCTKTGLTEGSKCEVCETVLKEQEEVKALGHDWDEGKVTKEPTCKEKGIKLFTCKRDPKHTKEVELAKIDHKYKNGKCVMCGKKAPVAARTGDTSNVMLWIAVAAATLLAMVAVVFKKLAK